MALPISSTPVYTLTIPSTDKQVKYRPFLVKEEKALLIAQQSEDPIVMVDTLKQIISACIKDPIEVEELATFDIEYIFSQIRAKSVGEVVELIFLCDDCESDDAKVKVAFDLTKIKVEKSNEHNKDIKLFNDVGVMMKYPSIEVINKLQSGGDGVDQIFDIIVECIDYIYDSTQIFYAKEQPKQDFIDFLENLTSEQFGKIQQFFDTIPKIRQEVEYDCPVCGKHHKKYLEGINSFF